VTLAAERPEFVAVVRPPRPSWYDLAECRGMTDLFHPTRGEHTGDAKQVCLRCPVRAQCLDYALDTAEHYGIWGGTSERERRALRRGRNRLGRKRPT